MGLHPAITDALHNFSDHLPVTVSLQTDAALLNINDVVNTQNIKLKYIVTKHTLNFYNTSPLLHYKKINIYNNLGQKVKTVQLNSDNFQEFDISNLQNGVYYIAHPSLNIKPSKFIFFN